MSAIGGVFQLRGEALAPQSVLQLQDAMQVQKHRGPNGTRFCALGLNGSVLLADDTKRIAKTFDARGVIGHNLLRVNEKRDVQQPFCNADGGIGVVYDGQIVNTDEIRADLINRGYCFETSFDAEVLLAAYQEYGIENMARKLNGVFVIALFDLNKRTVHILGDRYGAKPLYYTQYANKFVFVSELKGIIQFSDFERKINLDACNARLIFARTGSRVLLDNVKLLAPAEIITVSAEGVYSTTFFDWNSYHREERMFQNDEEAIQATEALFSKIVARQLEQKRMGIQLSGGIDSTLTAYCAKKENGEAFSQAVAIVDGRGDEGEEYYINYVANKLGLELHKLEMTPDRFLEDYENMIWHNDAPAYRPYFSCFMQLGRLAKQYADVLFCGEGADELTGGYSRFAGGALVLFLSKLNIVGGSVTSYREYAQYAVMAGETITDFTTVGYQNVEALLEERMNIFRGFDGSNLTKHLKFEIRECLPEASLRQDKMTMASSIQNRAPFLDNELVDLLMTMPEHYLVRFIGVSPLQLGNDPFGWMQGKWILKEIVAKHFGREFAYRKKMIMNLNEREMVTDPRFVEYTKTQIFPGMRTRGLFDAKKVENMFDQAQRIPSRQFTSMWKAIATETWCQLFLDKKAPK